ncbi:acyltransferase family protein [Planomonospora venezuelensis]|uniref:Peptidoglycan/LPS O-acetylase OafA/YrhL n=1 Tax=Planomonospora venezuelensis TaxID=1999 RepID=A0A841CUD6_PLAVE|nr:peptidoglycan/LPS O-acetylase OafA/YrhL [Planomonospora venezuelensis]GIN00122.1 acyltransferase [Planomonospora venezuelensis]
MADGHLDALDGVRAVASFLVLAFHVAAESGAMMQEGFAGALLSRGDVAVPIFFALSGVLLYRPFAAAALTGGPSPRIPAYLWRRAVRILPGYWLVVVVAMLLWSRDHISDAWTWLTLLLLGQNYAFDPWWTGLAPRGLAQMWSLAVEAAFYVLLPVIAAALAAFARRAGDDVDRRAVRLLAGLAAFAAVSYAWTLLIHYPRHQPLLSLWPPRAAGYFAAGMALAVVMAWARARPDGPAGRFGRGVAASPGSWWLVAAMAYAVAASPVTGSRFLGVDGVWADLSELVLYTAVAFCLLAPAALLPPGDSPVRRLLGNRVMRFLGKVSYGVFLWQFVAIYGWYGFTGQESFSGGFLGNLVPIALITLALATVTYLLLENPLQRVNSWVRR